LLNTSTYFIIAGMDIIVVALLFLSLSFITRDRDEEEETADTKLNRFLLKTMDLLEKYKITLAAKTLLMFLILKEVLEQVSLVITSNHMTELQKFSMINIAIVMTVTTLIFINFNKIRLFKKEKVEA
jgi:hypothetical protein